MGIFRHYLTLALFSAGLLFGVQAPNFVDQYEKRIDAHLMEAKAQLAGFSEIADRIYNGDIQKLIQQHAGSDDAAFREEQQVLRDNYERMQRFESAKEALRAPLAGKVIHIVFSPEKEVLRETVRNYTAAFPLTTDAILSGLVGALIICVVFEIIAGFLGLALRRLTGFGRGRRSKKQPQGA